MAKKKLTKQESPIMVWEVKQVRVRDLIPNELNPRTITADRLERLQDKISRLGFNQPVKLDHDGTLLGGNKRYRSLMEKGYGDLLIPAMVPPRALTEKERQEIIISDNVHEGAWDFDMLADHFELEDLKAWGLEDLPTIQEVLNEGECDEDEVPEARPEPKVVQGEVYILGNHRLMCGDSTAITDVERLMNGEKADMVFTDPPYNQGVNISGYLKDRPSFKKLAESDNLNNFKPDDFLSVLSILKVKSFYICCNKDLILNYIQYAKDNNRLWDLLAICKINPIPNKSNKYLSDIEWILFSRESGAFFDDSLNYDWYRKAQRVNVKASEFGHPTEKNVGLIQQYISISSKKNSNVFDLFGGSGSTLIACEKTDRKCFMMELDPIYCGVILDRWQKFTGKKAHREDGKPWDEIKEK